MTTPKNNPNTSQRRISGLFFVPIVAILIASIDMFLPRAVQTPSIFYPCTTTSTTQPQDTSATTSPPTIVLIPGLDGMASFFSSRPIDKLLLTHAHWPHCTMIITHLPTGATSFFDDVIPLLTPHADALMFHLPLRPASMSEVNYTFDYLRLATSHDVVHT